jgi:hypothetical protein
MNAELWLGRKWSWSMPILAWRDWGNPKFSYATVENPISALRFICIIALIAIIILNYQNHVPTGTETSAESFLCCCQFETASTYGQIYTREPSHTHTHWTICICPQRNCKLPFRWNARWINRTSTRLAHFVEDKTTSTSERMFMSATHKAGALNM